MRAWNTPDQAALLEELRIATTEDVRFTDLLTDVQGREPKSGVNRPRSTARCSETARDGPIVACAFWEGTDYLVPSF